MPEMIAEGDKIIPPDPLGSLSKMISARSGMIGLQQQQQALQTGQYTQQSAQATAQQDQQKNSEYQAAQKLAIAGAQSGQYTNSDGSLNRQKMADDITKVAPTYGQGIAGQVLSQANEIVSNKQALFNLTSDKRAKIGETLGALAGDPNVDHTKVIDAFENLRQQYPDDKELSRMLQSAGGAAQPNAHGAQLQQILNGMAAAATAKPSVQPGTTAAGQNVNRGTYSGQQDLPTGTAPNPTSPQVAGASARQTGTAGSDVERSNQVSALAKAAPAGIQTTQQIDDLADQIHSGKFAGWLSKQAASLGLKEDTFARQLLEKDLGIVKTQLTSAAPSDSRAATILSGTPEATSDPQTIHGAMDYVRGSLRQNLAQSKNLNAYRTKHPDLSGFQQADDTLTGGAGPLVHEFISLKPAQQSEFYKRNFSNAQQALEFRNKARAAAHSLGLSDGNG